MKTLLATESSHQMICHVGRVRPTARQRSEMFWYGNQRLMMGTNQDPACQPAERRVRPATCLAARYCQMTQSKPVARSERDDRMETTDVLWSYTSSMPRAPLSPLRKPVTALIPNGGAPRGPPIQWQIRANVKGAWSCSHTRMCCTPTWKRS